MNKAEILSALDEEISRLRQARDLLADASLPERDGHSTTDLSAAAAEPVKRKPGRPKGSSTKTATTAATKSSDGRAKVTPKRRAMSAEGKARIAEAQRARWARQHEGASKSKAPARKGAATRGAVKTAKKAVSAPGAKRTAAKPTAAKGAAKKAATKKSAAKKSVDASTPQTSAATTE